MIRWTVFVGLLLLTPSSAAAAPKPGMKEIRKDKDVEIAPGKWLTIKQIDVFLDEKISPDQVDRHRGDERAGQEQINVHV